MSSGIFHTAGRIWMTDASGAVTFDTNERCFIATDFKSGTYGPIGGYTARTFRTSLGQYSNELVDVTASYVLGSVTAGADTVIGSFQVTAADAYGVANIGWFCAGGSYQHGVMPRIVTTGTTSQAGFGGCAAYTFRASGGVLYLDQHTMLNAGAFLAPATGDYTVSHSALTFDYKLYVGSFN